MRQEKAGHSQLVTADAWFSEGLILVFADLAMKSVLLYSKIKPNNYTDNSVTAL